MENRKKPATAVPAASPTKAKPDDFEPPVTSDGPQSVDKPTPPPTPYDVPPVPPGR